MPHHGLPNTRRFPARGRQRAIASVAAIATADAATIVTINCRTIEGTAKSMGLTVEG